MRLGGYDINIRENTLARKIFKSGTVRRRFRHRLEVNPQYHEVLEKNGLILSGWDESNRIVKIIEIGSHPFFVAVQFHPELTSKLQRPSPLFMGLIESALARKIKKGR